MHSLPTDGGLTYPMVDVRYYRTLKPALTVTGDGHLLDVRYLPGRSAIMDIEEFRKNGYKVIDDICDYYASLREKPVVAQVEPGYLVRALPDHAPETGEDFSLISSDVKQHIIPGITHWQHPSFFAYFPAISSPESILADMYATAMSNPGFNWVCSPACTELETIVMDWAAKLLGLNELFLSQSHSGGGVINGSASESCLIAAIAARERCLRIISHRTHLEHKGSELTSASVESEDVTFVDVPVDLRGQWTGKMVMYGSTQTHSLGAKAALILGMQWRALPVYSTDQYALTGATLRLAIEEDTARGLVPFMVVATIGTTSSGAMDRIKELGEVADDYPTLFMHVDAAWAGVALALDEQRPFLRSAEINQYAHSFCTNFHKWGLVAFDASAMWVRDRKLLTAALDVTPVFLRSKQADDGTVIDYRNWGLALGRRFRSIKFWFVLRRFGIKGFQDHLRSGITQAEHLEEAVKATPNFELVTPRSLTLVVFRLNPDGKTLDISALNALNKTLGERLLARDLFLTQTIMSRDDGGEGTYCLRFALGGYRTEEADVMAAWAKVVEEGTKLIEA